MSRPCPACGCTTCDDMHAVLAALIDGDLDQALTAGLLDAAPCKHCQAPCRHHVHEAREERIAALAARERYHARSARLARLEQQRKAKREASRKLPASLPPAAAAALARALARTGKP